MLGFSSIGSHQIGGILLILDLEGRSERKLEVIAEKPVDSERSFEARATYIFVKPLTYRIIVYDRNKNVIGQVMDFRKLTFGKRLNNFGTAEFDLSTNYPIASDLIDLRKNYIEIYRDYNQDRDLVWAGEQAVRRSLLNNKGNNWSEIICYSWFEQLKQRYTEEFERYELENASDIVATLIATTQGKTGGNLGITYGVLDDTYLADIIYQNDNIADAILGLSDGGLDFEITDKKVLNVSSILGQDETDNVVLEYGYNITDMTIVEDFSQPVNQSLVLGEVLGEDTLQRVERTNTTHRTSYGLRQGRMNQLEPAILAIFEDKGDASIRKFGVPLIKVDFSLVGNNTPSINNFGVGDGIRLIVKDGIYNIDEEYRVFEWQLTVDKQNAEKLSLVLGKFTI